MDIETVYNFVSMLIFMIVFLISVATLIIAVKDLFVEGIKKQIKLKVYSIAQIIISSLIILFYLGFFVWMIVLRYFLTL